MLPQIESIASCLDDVQVSRPSIIFFFALLLSALLFVVRRLPVGAQTDCSSYNQCPSLQGEQNTKLNGAISYSFDDAALNPAFSNDAAKIQDFKARMTAAATVLGWFDDITLLVCDFLAHWPQFSAATSQTADAK